MRAGGEQARCGLLLKVRGHLGGEGSRRVEGLQCRYDLIRTKVEICIEGFCRSKYMLPSASGSREFKTGLRIVRGPRVGQIQATFTRQFP